MNNSSLKNIATAGRRLAQDTRGTTLALIAAAIIPLVGVIGGGLDIARAHLVKARLSQACDSAALAGRRAMSNDDLATAKPEAEKFFNHNFPQAYMGAAAFVPVITKPEKGTIKVVAATTVPTTLMKIFNYASIPVSVECDATQNFDNIDIVLVLDVTGSMNDTISGESENKIASMRKAVMALYVELEPAQAELAALGLRLRYAVVPYSTTVNVGKLVRAVNTNYMANQWDYSSRTIDAWGNDTYSKKTVDVSTYLTGVNVNAKTIVGGSDKNSTWNGCIEERQTTSAITDTSGTAKSDIPAAAFDLDIDLVPTTDNATKWGPQWDKVVYDDNGNNVDNWCPGEARRLAVTSKSAMQDYVDDLTPTGATYHDIGMIWGAHFISRGGIFATDNLATFNNRPVQRYVIFMTDGDLAPNSREGAAYGVEYLDQRVRGLSRGTSISSGNGSNLESRHSVRFVMACNAAKHGGASIYTIAFGIAQPPSLLECADNEDQAKVTTNSAGLKTIFKEIGKNIGALRLKK